MLGSADSSLLRWSGGHAWMGELDVVLVESWCNTRACTKVREVTQSACACGYQKQQCTW